MTLTLAWLKAAKRGKLVNYGEIKEPQKLHVHVAN